MEAQEIRIIETKTFEQECRTSNEVCVGTYLYGTDKPKERFNNIAVAIVRAKLEKEGFTFDEQIRMGSKCTEYILAITHPMVALRAHAEKL